MNVTIKFIGLLCVLLVGVVLGLQTAEKGINKVEGLPEQKLQTFYVKKIDKGQMEIAVMGKQVKTNPEKVANYVSDFGSSVGNLVKSGAQTTIDWFGKLF